MEMLCFRHRHEPREEMAGFSQDREICCTAGGAVLLLRRIMIMPVLRIYSVNMIRNTCHVGMGMEARSRIKVPFVLPCARF